MADDPALPLPGLDDLRPDPLPEVRRLLLFFPGASGTRPPRAKEIEPGRWEWECVVMGVLGLHVAVQLVVVRVGGVGDGG